MALMVSVAGPVTSPVPSWFPKGAAADVAAAATTPPRTTRVRPTTTRPRPAPATTPAPSSVPSRALTWSACGAVECGTLTVPLDHSRTDGPTVTLRTARRRATDQAARIGALIVNPGGPGGSAVELVRSDSFIASLPRAVASRFDIVGVDPRGIEGGLSVRCDVPAAPDDASPEVIAREFARACNATSGPILRHVGTDSSAADIEELRIALGEEQISFLGFSYGTYLGTLYLQRHPQRIRAAVLDAAMDPTTFGADLVEDQLRGSERTLRAFLAWCAATPARCAFGASGDDTTLRFERLQLVASQSRIGSDRISGLELEQLTARLLGVSWTQLGTLLADLARGRSAGAADTLRSLRRTPAGGPADGSYPAVACRDGIIPSARPAGDRTQRFVAAAPHFPATAQGWATERTCSDWAVPPLDWSRATPIAVGRVMVIGNTLDVRTPVEWAIRLAAQLGAPLVTFESYRHTASGSRDACVAQAVTSLLVSLVAPPADVFCTSSAR